MRRLRSTFMVLAMTVTPIVAVAPGAMALPPVAAGAPQAAVQAAVTAADGDSPEGSFTSKNAGRTVPEMSIGIDGTVYENKNKNYVEARDGGLYDGEDPFTFVGYNSPNYAFLEDPNWHSIENYEMEDLIKSVAQSHSKVVRVYSMGFQILPSYTGNKLYTENGATLQQAPKHIGWDPTAPKVQSVNPAPASYTGGDFFLNEPVWDKVDYFLATADRYGVRVVFPFVNEWDWFGGRGAFANYYGIGNRGSDFYGTNANSAFMGEMYDRLTSRIMNRVNTVSGIRYKDDPAVMAWETSNEFTGADSQWTIARGKHLHDDEGISQLFMDGTYTTGAENVTRMNAYKVRVASPYVDIMNDHFYASGVPNFVGGMVPLAQVAAAGGKPYVVGEYGLTAADEMDHLLRVMGDYGVDGAMVWSLRYRDARGGYYWHRDDQSTYDINYNSYHWPGFAENSEFEEKKVVDMIREYSYRMDGQQTPPPPVPDTAPQLLDIASPSAINWRGTTGANGYDVERATSADGPWTVVAHDLSDSMSVVREGPLFRDVSTQTGTSYWYRVRGRNVDNPTGWSPYSNVVGPVAGDVSAVGSNVAAGLDPGFESGDAVQPWSGDSTTPGLSFRSGGTAPAVGVAAFTTDPHAGARAVTATGTGELWFKTPVKPRTSYVASFWMKTTSAATKFTVLSRENRAGQVTAAGDVDPYQYRGPGPSNAGGVLAFSDYANRTILTSVDKEFSNSLSDVTPIADGQWHYYSAVFNGGDLDVKAGTTEANLVVSNAVPDASVAVDDVNVHETLLANSTFTGWGVRWQADQPWVFRSRTAINNQSTTALLKAVTGSGGRLSQQVRVAKGTDYALAFSTQNSSNGVKYAVLDEAGRYLVRPTTVPASEAFRTNVVRFATGDNEKVTVAFYDAVRSPGSFRVDELDLVAARHAAFPADDGATAIEPTVAQATDPLAIEDGDSALGDQAKLAAQWTAKRMTLTLDPAAATSGMDGVRVAYEPGGSAVTSFATPLDLSSREGLSLALDGHDSRGTVQLQLTDARGGRATWRFTLSDASGSQFVRFPAKGFDPAAVVKAELSVAGGTTGSFTFDELVAASPYLVDSGSGDSTWARTVSRPGEDVVTGRSASARISTGTAPTGGIDDGTSRVVTYSYNEGSNRQIKPFSQIGTALAGADWSDREDLQLWVRRGTTTPGSDTVMAVRLYLADGRYAEAATRLNDVAPEGQLLTLPLEDFTVFPTDEPFDPAASAVTGAGLVFSQAGHLVADVPSTGVITVGSPVVDNVVHLDDVRVVRHSIAPVTVRPGAGSASVSWTDPDAAGFSGVRVETLRGSTVVRTATVAPGVQQAVVRGLADGTRYTVRLTALAGTRVLSTATVRTVPGGKVSLTARPVRLVAGEQVRGTVALDGFSVPVHAGEVAVTVDPAVLTPVSAISRTEGLEVTGSTLAGSTWTIAFRATDEAGYVGRGPVLDLLLRSKVDQASAITSVVLGARSAVALTADEPAQTAPTTAAPAVTVYEGGFTALQQVVSTFSSKPVVAASLNRTLAAAERARDARTRRTQLNAFENQLAAQTGKAFTAKEAETLIWLVRKLR